MKITKTYFFSLLAALALAVPATAAYLGTEFGIEDDLTVFGTDGNSTADADLEIKGFTVFGSTEADHALGIPRAPGNIYANGYVQVSSGLYVAGSSTFTAVMRLPVASRIFLQDGIPGQVLKKQPDGSMGWEADADGGAGGITGLPLRLLMVADTGSGAISSLFVQNANVGTNVTMLAGSSMTILGDGTNGLGVTGAVKINGPLSVTGAASVGGSIVVNSSAVFGAGVSRSTFSAAGALDLASGAGITLSGAGLIVLPNLPAAGTHAANKNYVDSQVAAAGPWYRDNALNAVKLSTPTDSVGIGALVPQAKLHVSSAAAAPGAMLVILSTGTAASQRVFTVDASGGAVVKGGLRQGALLSDSHGVNMAPAADSAVSVAGEDVSGEYTAKFYTGGTLAVWIKKK
ncbi:MAG: hypothetical protein NDI60_07050 [Elusimicrobiales bacterium]|nr:hypothetical protein [Elusimicrobiales bacterium]